MPRLLVKTAGGPKSVPIGEEAVTFGRTNDNTIPLEGEGVSRKHAQVLFVGKGYEIVDLGSRNGTKVNGQKVPRAMLKSGDVISIGPVDIVFEDGAAGGASAGGLELEELDLGSASAAAPPAVFADKTGEFPAGGGAPTGDCVLRFVAGEKEGTELPLKGPRTTFGRKASNTVSFNDAAVSGVHCEITREANGYVLRDLGSTNGTQVDGEAVVETLLRHNARVRMGAQRAIFVDPTVADIESSLAGDDPAEWGLMKGEIDLSAARGRAGKSGLVVAAVALAATGVGGWFALQSGGSVAIVPPVKDNRIDDHSSEGGVLRWFPPGEEGGAVARIIGTPEAPRGASGVCSVEVKPPAEGPGLVEWSTAAAGGGDLTASPDTAYEISARVGSGRGAVVVTWVVANKPGLVREDGSPPVDGSNAWPETKAIVVAPAHTTGVRIGLVALGGAPAVFDDIVLRRAEGGAPPAFEAGELKIRCDATGALEAVRGGEILFTEASLAPAADTPPEALLGASLSSGPAMDGAALAAEGALPGGQAFGIRVQPSPAGTAIACVPKAGEGAFTMTCPGGAARGAVTLVMKQNAVVLPEQDSFAQEGVQRVIVATAGAGGTAAFVLSADPASPGFRFSSRRTPRGLRMAFAPPAQVPQGVDGSTVTLSVDLSRLEQDAEQLSRDAAAHAKAGRLGEAAAAWESVTLQFHYLDRFREPAAKELQAILDGGRSRLREAEALLEGSKKFRAVSAPDLDRAAMLGSALAKEFQGHPFAERGAKIAADAEKDLVVLRAEGVDARVERLFLRAVDYEANKQPMLALLLFGEVARLAPEGDERRDRAVERQKALEEELRKDLASRYGTRN